MALPTFTRTYKAVDVPKNVAPVNLSQQFAVMSANMNKQFVKQQEAALRAQTAEAKKASELLEYGLDFSTRNQSALYKNLQTAGVNNPELYTVADNHINEMTNCQIGAKKATSREDQAAYLQCVAYQRQKVNELVSLTNEGKAADQLFAEDFANGFNTVGRQGGVATAGNISFGPEEDGVDFNKYQLGMYVRNGVGKNLKEEFFVEDGVYKIKYTSDNIIKAGYKDGMVVDAKEFLGFQPETVPKSNEEIEDKLKNIWTKSKGANAVYQDSLVVEGEISADGNYITEKIKFKKENFFKDIANAVDPIAAGNLASGNQAEIDLQTTLIPHFIAKLGDKGSFTYTGADGKQKSITASELKNFRLQQGDGSSGGSKWDIKSQNLYKELFRNYAFDYTGVEKTINTNDQGGYFVSGNTTKYTGPRGGGGDFKTSASKERASTVIDLLSESPEQAVATYLGEIPFTRDGSKITITRESGDETWDLTIPSQFENLATELHKKKYGDDDKTLDAIRDTLKTKDFDAILKPPFVGPSNKPVLPVKK